MTKKHFRAFADAISQIHSPADRQLVARHVADICGQLNARFQYSTFYLACGLDREGKAIAGLEGSKQ